MPALAQVLGATSRLCPDCARTQPISAERRTSGVMSPEPENGPNFRYLPPPSREEGAARVELLDAVVAHIRDVDVHARVGRHAEGVGELDDARDLAPPRGEEDPLRG